MISLLIAATLGTGVMSLSAVAMVALHAGVPLVPAFYQGPNDVRIAHFVQRRRVRVTFGIPIPTAGLPLGKQTTMALTRRLQAAIGELRLIATVERSDA